MKNLKVRITFKEGVLGTQTGDKDVYKNFIASKSPDATTLEEEVANLGEDAVIEKGKTIFPKHEGKPFFYDYQIRGFFKSACSALKQVEGTKSSKVKAYKKKVDLTVFVVDRMNFIENYDKITECQRPLRCSTMQGERVSIAISEEIGKGATLNFTVRCLIDSDIELVKEWLDYGQFNGLGQWRNSSKGSFYYEILNDNGEAVEGNLPK